MIVNDPLQRLDSPKLFLFGLYGRQWSFMEPWLPKYVSYLDSMIVYKTSVAIKCVSFRLKWSSIIFYKASDAHICFLFVLYDRQWSTKFRSPKNVCHLALYDRQWSSTKARLLINVLYLFSMIVNDLLQRLSRKYVSYLDSIIVNDLLRTLSWPNMCLI